jgi:hypothetical protein
LSSAISTGAGAPPTETTTRWFRTRFIYIQRSTVEIAAIQLSNRGLRCRRVSHFDECESARLARIPVRHDIHSLHLAVSGERRMKIVLRSLITEISDKYVCHSMNSFLVDVSLSDCSRTNLFEGNVAAGRHLKLDTDAGKDVLSVSVFQLSQFLKARFLEPGHPGARARPPTPVTTHKNIPNPFNPKALPSLLPQPAIRFSTSIRYPQAGSPSL